MTTDRQWHYCSLISSWYKTLRTSQCHYHINTECLSSPTCELKVQNSLLQYAELAATLLSVTNVHCSQWTSVTNCTQASDDRRRRCTAYNATSVLWPYWNSGLRARTCPTISKTSSNVAGVKINEHSASDMEFWLFFCTLNITIFLATRKHNSRLYCWVLTADPVGIQWQVKQWACKSCTFRSCPVCSCIFIVSCIACILYCSQLCLLVYSWSMVNVYSALKGIYTSCFQCTLADCCKLRDT